MRAAGGAGRAADLVELALEVGMGHLEEPRVGMGLGWLSGSMADVRLGLFAVGLLAYAVLVLLFRVLRRWVRWVLRSYKTLESVAAQANGAGPDSHPGNGGGDASHMMANGLNG